MIENAAGSGVWERAAFFMCFVGRNLRKWSGNVELLP